MAEDPAASPQRSLSPRGVQGGETPWLIAFGLAVLALAAGSRAIGPRTMARDMARVTAAVEVQRDAAISHLWLEEHVSGDTVAGDAIVAPLERSFLVLRVLLGEQAPTAAAPDLEALEERDLLDATRTLVHRLERFRDISERRRRGFESGLPVGIGSAIDVEYDAVFGDVLSLAQELQAMLEARLERRRERSRLVLLAGFALGIALFAVALVALRSHKERRRRAEEALVASQAQFLQSQKLEALGRIAGGLAHDINNYLAAIRGHCELVLMKDPPEKVARKMNAAIRTVKKAAALIDRLLTFGQAQPLQLEIVNLNRMVDSLEDMLRPSVGEDVRLVKHLAADLWNVEADPSRLEQILVNLVVNAREAMLDGVPSGGSKGGRDGVPSGGFKGGRDGGEIVLSTANDPSRRQVMLSVADTGHGIAPEVRDKIFEPFWTTKAGTGNSGLGLATVYSIVQQSGGTIEVESKVGRGTVFRLFLPRSERAESAAAHPEAEPPAVAGGSESILLVDDNTDFRESTRGLLEGLGYHVVAAASGEEALEVFTQKGPKFDLVLTDVVMPGLSGPEWVARRRENGPVKVIFMSGYNEDVVLRHGVEEGEVHFLKKQFSSMHLARLIREVLDLEV